jgi:copper resistance protein B
MRLQNRSTKKIFNVFILMASCLLMSPFTHAHDHGEDPLLTYLLIDQLEVRDAKGANPMQLDGQFWIGKDINKLWLKADIEGAENLQGKTEDYSQVQALWSHAVLPYWDVQTGIRHDQVPMQSRDWAVLGIQGLAPYWFDVDAAIFLGEQGNAAAEVRVEYELLFTQKLILTPSASVSAYGQNDQTFASGAGIANTSIGLRLGYEICREFAPYVGVNWDKTWGKSATFATQQGESTHQSQWVMGMRVRF